MYLAAHYVTFGFCLAIIFPVGHSQITEQEASYVNEEVLKHLPSTECDMIVVSSSSPFRGETLCTLQRKYSV